MGGSPVLARLATDTGGRFTHSTNDLSLGLARAQHDLSCRYVVGIYLRDKEVPAAHRVKVRVKRPGVRAVHPGSYRHRSPEERRESVLRAAFAAPERFQSGIVRAHVFPLRPVSKTEWSVLLAVSFPVHVDETRTERSFDFGATVERRRNVRQSWRPAYQFSRRAIVKPESYEKTGQRRLVFLEPAVLPAGFLRIRAVLSDLDEERPEADFVQVELPEVPKRKSFLVGPIIGREAREDYVIRGSGSSGPAPWLGDVVGDETTFEPLLIRQFLEPVPMLASTEVCIVGSKKAGREASVERLLLTEEGETKSRLDPTRLVLGGTERIRCENLLDVIPLEEVDPGSFVFRAILEKKKQDETADAGFSYVGGGTE